MKFKLDENFGTRTVPIFRDFGHDVETVRDESLGGASDRVVFQPCIGEARCLVTLDLDFADVLRFPPHETHGVAVVRLPKHTSQGVLSLLVRTFLVALQTESILGRLWIIEAGRIRIHESTGSED